MANGENPILVEIWRGGAVESRHRGAAVVMDASGRIEAQWGDTAVPVFPRSAIKSVQALALVESGAADDFAVDSSELALACASHNGEPRHVTAVSAWLGRMGLGIGDLECGAHAPYYGPAHEAMIAAAIAPTNAHNNCSGKHAGMLAVALKLGADTSGYIRPDHPVQRRVRAILSEMCGYDHETAPMATDGCGIPTYAAPLTALARAMARMADPRALAPTRVAASARIRAAIAAHPDMVAGTGRFCTEIMAASGPRILVKTGAEGVFAAALPESGLGIALKIDDGGTRASECAMAVLLARHAPGAADEALAKYGHRALRNWAGADVGAVRPAARWLG